MRGRKKGERIVMEALMRMIKRVKEGREVIKLGRWGRI